MTTLDWPIGTPEERAAATNRLPGSWFDANPFMTVYKIGGQGNDTLHTGADLNNNNPVWNSDYHSPIYAIGDGVVMFAGPAGGSWGHSIVIKHDGCYSRYGHIEKTIVKAGDKVVMGQQIANVGNGDGYYVGYEHLHFDISVTDLLGRQPNEWPNMNEALLRANYVAPIPYIIAHKQGQAAQPAPESEPVVTAQKYYVTQAGSGLRLRKYYGVSEVILSALGTGTALDGYDLTVDKDSHTWRLVAYNGQYGWVADNFISLTPPGRDTPAPTVPPAVAPITRTKVGLHIGSNAPGQALIDMAKRLHDSGHPLACVTVISDADLANKLAPYTTIMFRMVWDGRERYSTSMLDGLTAAQAEALGRAFYHGEHKQYNDSASKAQFLKFTNEVGWHPLDWAFAIGLMKAADDDNRKVAIFGDSMSTPTVEQWQERLQALRYAALMGHAVTLNQYGPYVNGAPSNVGVGDVTGDFTDYGKHPFNLYDSVPADCRPLLIIGEAGQSDSTAHRETAFVVNDARNYDLLTRQYPYLMGFCYFTMGQWIGKPNASLDYALPQFEALVASA